MLWMCFISLSTCLPHGSSLPDSSADSSCCRCNSVHNPRVRFLSPALRCIRRIPESRTSDAAQSSAERDRIEELARGRYASTFPSRPQHVGERQVQQTRARGRVSVMKNISLPSLEFLRSLFSATSMGNRRTMARRAGCIAARVPRTTSAPIHRSGSTRPRNRGDTSAGE
jgi:hypothetical protein